MHPGTRRCCNTGKKLLIPGGSFDFDKTTVFQPHLSSRYEPVQIVVQYNSSDLACVGSSWVRPANGFLVRNKSFTGFQMRGQLLCYERILHYFAMSLVFVLHLGMA